jgi:cytoskeleton protein RodZ
MVESVGKKLNKARIAKKISIEDAARITRIRPERLVDLENDDYSNFPSITYTKGFLQIYAKFLGVDVSNFTETFADVSPIGTDDYEYLANAPVANQDFEPRPQRETSTRPLLIAIVVIIMLAFLVYLVNSIQRLGNLDRLADKAATQDRSARAPIVGVEVPEQQPALSEAAQAKASPPQAAQVPVASAIPVKSDARAASAVPAETTAPVAAQSAPPTAEAIAAPLPVPSAVPAPPPGAARNEVVLKSLKKTWVVIHKNGQNSESIFEDWLYPDAQPLVLRGNDKYWIQLGDRDGVQIQKNGQPIAYQAPGVTIE